MATATRGSLRYTLGSLNYEEKFHNWVSAKLRELVEKKVTEENRNVVQESDIQACFPKAVEIVLNEMRSEGLIESSEKH